MESLLARHKKGKSLHRWVTNRPDPKIGKLRIVGGHLKGRQFNYSGDQRTRPMKDNIREALFNLVGGWISGKAVFDLFSGTGAVALESLSRGAERAIVVERHFPTAKLINENATELGVIEKVCIETADTFFWYRQFKQQPDSWPVVPWAVFVCPPYALFETDGEQLVDLIAFMAETAPEESIVVVEFDERFDPNQLPFSKQWKIREYSPAILAILRKSNDLSN
jgi:16S rRNA (guanine966-N2)-methyltransferase